MMNPQMAAQHQAPPYQNHMPQQPQNVGQQRQMPNGQQAHSGQQGPNVQQGPNGAQKGGQGQQQMPNAYSNYNPQLTLWTLEKAKNVESWDDVEPEKQHVALEDLQNELIKFRRSSGPVNRALDEIPSSTCRRLINELVEKQSKELSKFNRSLEYKIAGISIGWRWADRRKTQRQLKRVKVILKTEPSAFQEPQNMKSGAGGGAGNELGAHDINKSMKPNGMAQNQQPHGHPNNQGPNMAQQMKNKPPQGQHMGPTQNHEQHPPPPQGGHGGHAPPPPPPPPVGHPGQGHPGQGHPGQGHPGHGPAGTGAPLPPPPPPNVTPLPPPPHGVHHPHGNVMPGAFPGAVPMHGGGKGQPSIQVQNHRSSHGQKTKHKSHHESSSSSESDSAWESEATASSTSDRIRVRNVEDGDYTLLGRHGRSHSKRSSRSKKSRRSKSRGHGRSRSTSRAPHHSSRRRRESDSIHPPMGRHNSSGDERGRSYGKESRRRESFNGSPTRTYNKKKLEKIITSEPMSRGSSWESWERSSDVASFATSATTADEGSYDSHRRPRGHGRTHSYSRQHHGSFTPPHRYEDQERRHDPRYAFADDYPHNPSPPRSRDPYHHDSTFNSRPQPPRRHNSTQHRAHSPNPFDAARFPPKLARASTYAGDMHERDFAYAQQSRYMPGSSPVEDRFKVEEIVGAVLEQMEKKTHHGAHPVPLRRRNTDRRDSGIVNDDEWDQEHPSARGRTYGGYGF